MQGPDGVLDYPAWFVGTVERTYRIGVGVSGRLFGFDIAGSGGYHHVLNGRQPAGRDCGPPGGNCSCCRYLGTTGPA
ncbi:MAG TPA: hypothetical protein VHJ69_10055 [Gemmatimonadales bacterium]|nr:hypothetical protein [Gemmatimonadales bacterium]